MFFCTQQNVAKRHFIIILLTLFGTSVAGTVKASDNKDQNDYVKISKKKLPKVNGRLAFEAVQYQSDVTHMGSGIEIRYARLSVKGRVDQKWKYRLEYDFAGKGSIKNVWLAYQLKRSHSIKIGNLMEPFSMDEMTSSKNISFLERALPNAFVPSYHLGVVLNSRHSGFSFSGGAFGGTPSSNPPNEGSQGYGVSGRMTYAPIETQKTLLHFGLSASASVPDSTKTVRFRERPESNLTSVRLVDTGKINNVVHDAIGGLEAAAMLGPVALQGEYIKARVVRTGSEAPLLFKGAYTQMSVLLGDALRSYKHGTFGTIKTTGDVGVWELALRYSYLDLNSNDISGGEEHNLTFGINYYFNPRLRMMANYIKARAYHGGITEQPKIFTVRIQAYF